MSEIRRDSTGMIGGREGHRRVGGGEVDENGDEDTISLQHSECSRNDSFWSQHKDTGAFAQAHKEGSAQGSALE